MFYVVVFMVYSKSIFEIYVILLHVYVKYMNVYRLTYAYLHVSLHVYLCVYLCVCMFECMFVYLHVGLCMHAWHCMLLCILYCIVSIHLYSASCSAHAPIRSASSARDPERRGQS